ncbi:unnamed protein product [Gongylonema pulchrum]|uniref:MSP domain-containing protein n=1 Tax=Gongylonema pulchrum TaxID=637853 RepID=A0A183D7D6_9BILA|nr:unnamed protein product [Gongylonema pulchrum]
MEVPLLVDPHTVEVKASGGVSTHQIHNTTQKRFAIKIKSSNIKDYILKPVYTFLEPGKQEPLVVTRKEGPAGKDKLVIEFLEAPATEKDAQAFWKGKKSMGEVIVPVICT